MNKSPDNVEPTRGPLRVAQIGLGYWGPNLVRNFAKIRDIDEFTACDMNPERTEFIRNQFPNVRTSNDCEHLLRSPDIDAVVLATPAETHYTMAKTALNHGKHVFVEKPLTYNMAEADDLLHLAKEQRRVIMVGHTFLYNEAVHKVKEYIDSGELGDIYYISTQRLNLGKVRTDVNAWWNLAPHDVSVILYWLGQMPTALQAKGMMFLQDELEDVVFAELEFPGGQCAHIHVSWLDPLKTRRMVVVGSKKMIVYDDTSLDQKITIYDKGIDKKNIVRSLPEIKTFGQFQFMHRIGDVLIPSFKFVEPLMTECNHFIDCIRNGISPRTDGAHGRDVVSVMAGVQQLLDDSRKTT